MDSTYIKKRSGIKDPSEVPKSTHYMFWGAVIGMFAGLVSLFAASTGYAAMTGLEPVNCAIFGSFMTVTLSQPAALFGVAVGTACGGICALAAHCVHHSKAEC